MKLTKEQLDEMAKRDSASLTADEFEELVRLAQVGLDVEDGAGAPMPFTIG